MLEWRYHQLLSGFLASSHLPRVSCQLRLSAYDKGDNEMKPTAVYRFPAIYIKPEANTRTKIVLMKTETSHDLKWGPLAPNEVGRVEKHSREGEHDKKARKGCKTQNVITTLLTTGQGMPYNCICVLTRGP
jgi:hypothetical protein